MNSKNEIKKRYQQLLQDRIDVLRDMLEQLTVGAQTDAKGSAGDKHETALAMMHLEQEKLNAKLQEVLDQKALIDRIDTSQKLTKVALGALVQVNELWLFIAAALPKITLEDKTIIAVSPHAPLGSALIGKEVNFEVVVNGTQYKINHLI
jgi:transcription elongation GreA/GreB family factor